MKRAICTVAATELLLVSPAVLFLAALFLRDVQPVLGTGHIVAWYAQHTLVGLFVCLIGMPLMALFAGGVLLSWRWRRDAVLRQDVLQLMNVALAQRAELLIALATLVAGGVLVVAALHLITE